MEAYRLCSLLLSLAALVSAQPPIPARQPGLEYGRGNSDASVDLEVFLDPCCPDSKQAWPTMKNVQELYGGGVRLLVHGFPLPYHRNSFLTTQAFYLVNGDQSKDDAFRMMDALFGAYPEFGNSQTMNMTETQVIRSIAGVAHAATGVDVTTFISKMTAAGAPSDGVTRVHWKYACTRGVYGTPQFLVNGVTVNGGAGWTVKEWRAVLDPLVENQGDV